MVALAAVVFSPTATMLANPSRRSLPVPIAFVAFGDFVIVDFSTGFALGNFQ